MGSEQSRDAADMTNRMFLYAGLSNHNYDALLIGWSAIDADESGLQADVSFHAGDSPILRRHLRQSYFDRHL